MRISYFGHCAVQVELGSGTTILFDPYRNEEPRWIWFKRPFPPLTPDYLIITHPHFDHDNVAAVAGTPTVIRHPLTLEAEDFRLHGFRDKHSRGFGAAWGAWNIIFTLEAEGLRLCHWGDNRAELSDAQWEQLSGIDVLFVTVDDEGHLLEFEEVATIIERLQPKIVFPTHYYIEGLNDPSSGLGGVEKWLSLQQQVKYIPAGAVDLMREPLPQQTEIWKFEQIAF
ncbi:MAG: MBL fold metallo-hydrolase [Chloroflexota bacterium]